MSSLSLIGLVAKREIKERGKSKPYLITSGLTALFVIALIVLPGLFGEETDTFEVGSLGEGNTAVIETAEILGNIGDEAGAEPSVRLDEVPFESREAAEAALLDGDVSVVMVDGTELIIEREGGFFGSGGGPTDLLQQAAGAIALEQVITESGESAEAVIDIISSQTLEVTPLVEPDGDTDAASAVAYFGLLLLYMAIILYGTWILTGVTEEKSNRVVEVMISAIRPWQLLAGKIVGIGFLALVQFIGTIAIALVTVRLFATFEIPEISPVALINLAIWFVLGFLLYAVMFGAAGSLVGRVEDAQSAAMPMTIFSVIGFFAGFAVLGDPDGVVAVISTFVPFTAPFTVPIRVSLQAIAAWEYALAVIITVASIYLAVRAAGRIYAGGILKSGSRTKIREAWRSADG
ncbi:MAG: ABC transporter permease [Acidimicrobiia bacterium]